MDKKKKKKVDIWTFYGWSSPRDNPDHPTRIF